MKLNRFTRGAGLGVILSAALVSLTACADEEKEPPREPNKDLLPFSVGFTLEGEPVVLDANGERIPPTEVAFPIKATAIERVDSVTLVQYRGSHVQLIKVAGKYFAIPLPH